MAGLVVDDSNGVLRSISDVSPIHYTVEIRSFSLLTKNSIERYESGQFEAGGYKWKLVIYPNGNKSRNANEHLSLYLAMAGANSLRTGWQVDAVFRLFLLDQNNDNYMVLQDAVGKERRFHKMKLERGFDQFISLKALRDAANGFLVDDTCVFGAEVFVCKERTTDKGECLQMIKDPIMYKHTFKVENYSKLAVECSESEEFNAADQKWTIKLYPKGKGAGSGTHLSLCLALVDPKTLPSNCKIYAEYTLRVLNQFSSNHYFGKASEWFSASSDEHGWSRFMTLAFFRNSNSGYLFQDASTIEAEVTIHGIVDVL